MKPIIPERSTSSLLQIEVRALICDVLGDHGPGAAAIVAKANYPGNRAVLDRIERTSSTAMDTTSAAALSPTALLDSLPVLGPGSAARQILAKLINLGITDAANFAVPDIVLAGNGRFVGQGLGTPMRQLAFATNPFSLKKLATGFFARRELFVHSNAEALITPIVKSELGLSLEKLLLDNEPADDLRPAGLRFGIDATATVGTGNNTESMIADLSELAASVSLVGAMDLFYVVSVPQAIRYAMRKTSNAFPFAVIGSSVLDEGDVICIASNSVVVSGDAAPRVQKSTEATFQADDSPAALLSTTGTPNAAVAPIVSLFQTDSIAVRIVQDMSWLLRNELGVAHMSGALW